MQGKSQLFCIHYLSKTKHKSAQKKTTTTTMDSVFDQIAGPPCKNSANPREIEKWPKIQYVMVMLLAPSLFIFYLLCSSRKCPKPSHRRLFGLDHSTPLKIPVLSHFPLKNFDSWSPFPPPPLEFPVIFFWGDMDILWNHPFHWTNNKPAWILKHLCAH